MTSAPEQLIQADLPLAAAPAPAADACAVLFVEKMAEQKCWLTAAAVLSMLGLAVTESNKRHVRQWCAAARGQILSGQKGYLHIRNATAEEVQHAANWLEHQAVEMGGHARDIRKTYHQLIHTDLRSSRGDEAGSPTISDRQSSIINRQ